MTNISRLHVDLGISGSGDTDGGRETNYTRFRIVEQSPLLSFFEDVARQPLYHHYLQHQSWKNLNPRSRFHSHPFFTPFSRPLAQVWRQLQLVATIFFPSKTKTPTICSRNPVKRYLASDPLESPTRLSSPYPKKS